MSLSSADAFAAAQKAGISGGENLVSFAFGYAAAFKAASVPSSKPKLIYFPIAGRGETARLIAAAGGLDYDFVTDIPEDKSSYGSPSGVPLLEHGDLKMSQSLAVERYFSSIAPKYANLTLQQRAVDDMFAAIKEDLVQGFAGSLFNKDKDSSVEIPKVVARYLPIIEGLLPESGFVNGLEIPTTADLTLINIRHGYMPFGAAFKQGGLDAAEQFAKYPKFLALVERASAAPGVKEYLASTKTMAGAFPGF